MTRLVDAALAGDLKEFELAFADKVGSININEALSYAAFLEEAKKKKRIKEEDGGDGGDGEGGEGDGEGGEGDPEPPVVPEEPEKNGDTSTDGSKMPLKKRT